MGIVFHPERGLHHALLAITVAFFMHGGLFHLLSNMWYLWIFGALTERHIGGLSFLTVYVACGIMSMVIEVASTPLSTVPLVGASGAIAGIMGVTLVLLPLSRILVWIPPVFVVPIPAFIFLLLWFGIQYVNVGRDPAHGGGIAWWAHIGGYLTGVVAAFFIRKEGAGKRGRRNA
jgi:membrane associated rhomboid family serine protease